jgi:hypothetical protein
VEVEVEVELELELEKTMTDGPSDTNHSAGVGGVVPTDVALNTRTYSRWTSLATGVVLALATLGLLAALGLTTYLPTVLLGIATGLALYEGVRLLVVHSDWRLLRSPVARRAAEAVGFVQAPIESDAPSRTRARS